MAEGYLDFTAGQVLTAAQVEEYLLLQTTLRFASAAARDTALSGVLTEGLRVFLKDTNCEQTYTGSAWSTTGPVHGAALTWTPTLTQGVGVTATVTQGTYTRIGRRIFADCRLDITSAGTTATMVTVTLPVAALTNGDVACGDFWFTDTSESVSYAGTVSTPTSTSAAFAVSGQTGAPPRLGVAPSLAVASSDILSMSLSYIAAADA